MTRSDTAREGGFALLLVLIALATLSLVVAAVLDSARRYSAGAEASVESVTLRAAQDAAVATAADELTDAGAAHVQLLSHPETFEIGSTFATVTVKPESAKIDLNAAAPELLNSLLLASGLKADKAASLADEIADWRDPDGEARPHGAEAAEYLAAGRSYTPSNKPFESESELSLLLDGGADLVACLAPDVTVFTRRTDVDATAASARVREALGIGGRIAAPGNVVSGASVVGGQLTESAALFEIDVSVTDGRRHVSRQVILRPTGNAGRPIWVLAQSSPVPTATDVLAACTRLKKGQPIEARF